MYGFAIEPHDICKQIENDSINCSLAFNNLRCQRNICCRGWERMKELMINLRHCKVHFSI